MCARNVEGFDAFQLIVEFKLLVYDLFNRHPAAQRDFKYRDQVYDAISSAESNFVEGFSRFKHKQMAYFIRISLGSLEECKTRVIDGVHRGHFKPQSVATALRIGYRALRVTLGFLRYLESSPD